MADFKPILLNAILEREEQDIRTDFPHGVALHKQKAGKLDRFSPCPEGKKPHTTLDRLVKLKRERLEDDLIPHKDSTRGYTSVPALGMFPDAGSSPPKAVLNTYAEENWQQFMAGLEAIGSRNPRLYARRRVEKKEAAAWEKEAA